MKILISDPLGEEGVALLKSEFAVEVRTGLAAEQLLNIIGDYDALVVRSATKVNASLIEAGSKLKVIGRAGVGVDNIDVEKATEKGIMVINSPEANTISTAEHTIALLTALARNVPAANNAAKRGEWKKDRFLGVELTGKTLGTIGLGRVGSEVARRARAMGMHVLAIDPYVSAERAAKVGARMVTQEELLKESDFITLHLPLVDSTRYIIGERELAMMKPGVRLVNCARGGLVDEEALYRAVTAGKVAGVALDVMEQEPPPDSPLFKLDNVIVTPHLGASTQEAQINVSLQVAEQILKALKGEPVSSAVNFPALLPEVLEELQPFFPLMRILGSFYMQMFGGHIDEIEIHYGGDVAGRPLAPLTASCLVGLLRVVLGDQVNLVNAPYIARQRGIKVRETATATAANLTNLIALHVRSGSETNTVAGTLLNGNEMRIVQIGSYRMEVVPSRHMLVTYHHDLPGVVGKVGTLLGNAGVNIASMQLSRERIGGEAIMLLQVDDPMSPEMIRQVQELDVIARTRFVTLPEKDLNGGT